VAHRTQRFGSYLKHRHNYQGVLLAAAGGRPRVHITLAFFALMLLTRGMLTVAGAQNVSLGHFAQAYGTGTYGCGTYEEGCATTGQTAAAPGVPNTGMLLSEPSFVVPGSLLLAILLAMVILGITKLVRRKRSQ